MLTRIKVGLCRRVHPADSKKIDKRLLVMANFTVMRVARYVFVLQKLGPKGRSGWGSDPKRRAFMRNKFAVNAFAKSGH